MSPFDIILRPWSTEKALEARSQLNRLEFIVRMDATKAQIRRAVESLLDVNVDKVNTRITQHGKHASVMLAEGNSADEAAMRLGMF